LLKVNVSGPVCSETGAVIAKQQSLVLTLKLSPLTIEE